MAYLDEELDALSWEAAGAVRHAAGCGCGRCGQGFDEAATRRNRPPPRRALTRPQPRRASARATAPRAFRPSLGLAALRIAAPPAPRPARSGPRQQPPPPAGNQTPASAVGPQLPAWRGWSGVVTLQELIDAVYDMQQRRPVRPFLAPFLVRRPNVYRISRAGVDRRNPLTIGLTKNSNSVANRVIEHFRQQRGDPRVRGYISGLHPRNVLVQMGLFDRRHSLPPRAAKAYEIWLQMRERPVIYNPNSTSFDEAGFPLSR